MNYSVEAPVHNVKLFTSLEVITLGQGLLMWLEHKIQNIMGKNVTKMELWNRDNGWGL